MKHYFIGINRRTDELIEGLYDLGATLMFRHHIATISLNERYNFHDGEWMLFSDVIDDGTGIEEIRDFLDGFDNLKYEIVLTQDWRTELL